MSNLDLIVSIEKLEKAPIFNMGKDIIGDTDKLKSEITDLKHLVFKLEQKLNANVNLMDDVLTNTNSVLTTWVGFITIFVAVATILIMVYFKNKDNKDIVKEAVKVLEKNKEIEEIIYKIIDNRESNNLDKEKLKKEGAENE